MATSRQDVVVAAHVLSSLGLVTAFGHVSVRDGDAMVITPAADLAFVVESALVDVALDAEALPPGAPAEAWAHLAVYRARPDAASIARAQPLSTFAAAAVASSLVPLHGQAAWLGAAVPVHHSGFLLRTPDRAAAAAASLPGGRGAAAAGQRGLTLGSTPGVAVTRMWLLAAMCDTFLSTRGAPATPLTNDEVTAWRAVGPELLPRLWQHLQTLGGHP